MNENTSNITLNLDRSIISICERRPVLLVLWLTFPILQSFPYVMASSFLNNQAIPGEHIQTYEYMS